MSERICPLGLTELEVLEHVGRERLQDFRRWMTGQTVAICDGRRYNHESKEYEATECGNGHGVVTYSWDVNRYLSGGRVVG